MILFATILFVLNISPYLVRAEQEVNTEGQEEVEHSDSKDPISTVVTKEVITPATNDNLEINNSPQSEKIETTEKVATQDKTNVSIEDSKVDSINKTIDKEDKDSMSRTSENINKTFDTTNKVIESKPEENKVLADENNSELNGDFTNLTIDRLQVSSLSSTTIRLSWSKVNDATSYEIYQSIGSPNNFKLVDTAWSTSLSIKGIVPGTINYFKVQAVNEEYEDVLYSQFSELVSVKTSLDTPSNLKIKTKTYNTITLAWSKVVGADGYEIYMATSKSGTYKKVKSISTTSFKHSNLTTNKNYYYKIKAFSNYNEQNFYSPYSKVASANTTLQAVSSVKTKGSKYYITVSWNSVSGATHYKIYRATSKNGKYTLIKKTKSKSFVDKSVLKRKTYYYKIVATRTVGSKEYNSKSSAEKSEITRASLKPQFSINISDETYYSTDVVVLYLENNGSLPIKILSNGALSDNDYYSYDRLLQLIDVNNGQDLSWHKIGGGGSDFVAFRMLDASTWYIKSQLLFSSLYMMR